MHCSKARSEARAANVLEELLGGSDPAPAHLLPSGDDAATLLREADRLWRTGREAEAAGIYRRLRDGYPLTAAYVMNKKRIEARAKE